MGEYLTPEAAREVIAAALDAVVAAHDALRATSTDLVGNAFRIEVVERLETQHRVNRGLSCRMVGEIVDPPDGPDDPAPPPPCAPDTEHRKTKGPNLIPAPRPSAATTHSKPGSRRASLQVSSAPTVGCRSP